MLKKVRPGKPSPAMAVALLALFVALGGSAYAVNTVGSADIIDESILTQDVRGKPGTATVAAVNGSLTGDDIAGQPPNAANGTPYINGSLSGWDLTDGTVAGRDLAGNAVDSSRTKNDSLTGADIIESSLAKVPDADTLDGVDSSDLMRGAGRLVANRIVRGADNLTTTLLNIPGLGYLDANCGRNNQAAISWWNTTGANVDLWNGAYNGQSEVLGVKGEIVAPNYGPLIAYDASWNDTRNGATFSIGQGNGPGSLKMAVVHAYAYQSADGQPCGFQAHATVWTG